MTRTIALDTGADLPSVGLGFWKVDKPLVANLVQDAIRVGYRHLDCACDYGNEAEVGDGLTAALESGLCTRDELWITSKLWNTYHRAEHVEPALRRTLADLKLDYLDLYLIHFPIATKFVPFEQRYPPEWIFDPNVVDPKIEYVPVSMQETWQAMEGLVESGLVKNIGLCNVNCQLLREMLTYTKIRPSVLQVESHPQLTQEKLIRFCHEQSIAVTAFSPLGAESYYSLNMAQQNESILQQPVVKQIAEDVGKTAAQVVLRWGVQRGTAIVPKTTKLERLKENLAVFDFELSPTQMEQISALNKDRRFNDPGHFCEAAFNTFFPIYE